LPAQPANGTLAARYTTYNGLTGNEVVKTLKDDKGFLWIATHNGISRFDGKSFKNFTHNPSDTNSLRSIWVTDLLQDKNHTIWATTEWGLCYYDELQNRFRYIHPKDVISVLYKAPVMVDAKGTIWLAAENGLFKINALTRTIEQTSLTRIADPHCITEDETGNIIIGTRGDGIYWYYPSTGKYKKPGYTAISSSAHVLSFLTYNSHTWAATEEGILEIYSDNKAELFNRVTSPAGTERVKPLVSIAEYTVGDTVYFLCSTYDKKFLLFNPVKKTVAGYWNFSNDLSGSPALIHHILTEKGTAWLSAQTGLYKIETGSQPSQFQPLPVKSENGSPYIVQSILPDNRNPGICWILTEQDNGTLLKYDMQRQTLLKKNAGQTPFKAAGSNDGDLLQDESGRVFTFMDHYINIYTTTGNHIKEIKADRYINCACFDRNGNIWLGTGDGIAFFNTRTFSIQYYDCTFAGTDVERRSFSQSFATNDILDNDINSLWLCSAKYGLFSFNKQTGVFTPYRQSFSGSYSTLNRCTSLLLQKDTIWMGTMAGLTAFIPATKKFINLNISNGLNPLMYIPFAVIQPV
jgi:ligand-binding sensor domain-containing protein